MKQANLQPHIKLKSVDKVCLISGNPDRVPIIASYLKDPREAASHRGLVSYKGFTPKKGIPVTVLTTGMGCPSTAIVLEEAYRAGGRIIIRIGSCGSLQPGREMGIGAIFVPHAAVRDEGTSPQFASIEFPAAAHPEIHRVLCDAAKSQAIPYNTGVVWSTDVYYSPDVSQFRKWAEYGAVCVEMESSLVFIFGSVKGDVLTGAILTSDGNLVEKTNIYTGDIEKNYDIFQEGVKKAIECAINAVDMFHES
ncbi:MAG: nucleoside phosphorylase [Candidatus Heimdallarchaeota archaeon]|nr:MAG: nucleoside phosphorylase [Candidatus Heimdallarchaeota archaeon]